MGETGYGDDQKGYTPLKEVRKNFKVPWYRCPIDRNDLKKLTRRSDIKGAFQTIGHLVLVVLTGGLALYFFNAEIWVGFAIALFAHGTIYSFIPGLATHELSHGTVFRTKWLNGFFLRLFGLLSWFNHHVYKMSHTYHHLYTLFPKGDREVLLPIKPTLRALHLLQLSTVNLFAGGEPWSFPMVPIIGGTVKLAVLGKLDREWLDAIYEDQPEEKRKAVRWARLILLFHIAIIAASIVLKLWKLPVLITFAPFIANWWRYLVSAPMHTGLKTNVPDFRLCARSITLDPLSEFIYWRMNWHIEHHMFAAIPCYNLRKLHKKVAHDMPKVRSIVGSWKEMRETWKKQQTDPDYEFETPLPQSGDSDTGKTHLSNKALGDLAPDGLE